MEALDEEGVIVAASWFMTRLLAVPYLEGGGACEGAKANLRAG